MSSDQPVCSLLGKGFCAGTLAQVCTFFPPAPGNKSCWGLEKHLPEYFLPNKQWQADGLEDLEMLECQFTVAFGGQCDAILAGEWIPERKYSHETARTENTCFLATGIRRGTHQMGPASVAWCRS